MVRVEFTLKRVPISPAVKDQCGLPLSCVFQPFANTPELSGEFSGLPQASDVGRCSNCYSYVNCFCSFNPYGWICAICGRHNDFKPAVAASRYQTRPTARQALPELRADVYEALCDEPEDPDHLNLNGQGPAPVYIALVDTSGGEDFLELVRSALLAALEALPSAALFGLISFSNKIGLHDVKSKVPTARFAHLLESQPLMMPLGDILPLSALIAPVGQFKDSISQALEALQPDPSFERTRNSTSSLSGPAGPNQIPSAGNMQRTGQLGVRGFGPTLQAVLDYLRRAHQAVPASGAAAESAGLSSVWQGTVKLLTFLSGPPDLGVGKIINPRRRRAQPQAQEGAADSNGTGISIAGQMDNVNLEDEVLQSVSPQSVQFYEQAAVAAASLGVCLDLFAVSPAAVGLRFIAPVANSTGGAVYLYPSAEDSALPQDVYRRLSVQAASTGLLRIRTSPQLRVARTYGRLFADQQYDNLYHAISTTTSDTFAVDLDFTSPQGFLAPDAMPPTIQIAFQYNVLVPAPPSPAAAQQDKPKTDAAGAAAVQHTANGNGSAAAPAAAAAAAAAPSAFVLQRRLRVLTARLLLARTPGDVYANVNPDAVVAVLMHKIVRAARMEGLQEARLLLRDWLVILASDSHRHSHTSLTLEQLAQVPVDLSFAEAEALQTLPRMVYALLRSPLLAIPAPGQHPDLTAFLEHLWACLPPSELMRAIYPVLTSFTNPDTQAYPRHSLSKAALMSTDAPIFLLDAYIVIVVYYAAKCSPDVPFPPPQSSTLRKIINATRHERRITPQLRFLREGSPDVEVFTQLLLDEPEFMEGASAAADSPGGPARGTAVFGLVQFLDHVRDEVSLQIKHEATRGRK